MQLEKGGGEHFCATEGPECGRRNEAKQHPHAWTFQKCPKRPFNQVTAPGQPPAHWYQEIEEAQKV